MKSKRFLMLSTAFLFCCFVRPAFSGPATKPLLPIFDFLNDIEYTSRFKIEYDDNIFSVEDRQDSDFRQVFTQGLSYRLPKENYYFEWGYTGNYAYYDQEATGLLGHSANVLYSYRPFSNVSIGLRDDYNWLGDSKISTTLGDRVFALGYIQNTPAVEVKYELSPSYTLKADTYYQFLDVVDSSNDDFIDNKRVGISSQLEYNFTPQKSLVGFLGLGYSRIDFSQTVEKASTTQRLFVGVTEKIPGLIKLTQEIGFADIDMEENSNMDDANIDYKFSAETIFSVYTKLNLAINLSTRNPSLRSDYTQYTSNAAVLGVSHVISPKTSAGLSYSYEDQDFLASDVLIGQPKVHKNTRVQGLEFDIVRKIKSWLTLDLKYEYTKRDTDFEQEGYIDNRYSATFTVKY